MRKPKNWDDLLPGKQEEWKEKERARLRKWYADNREKAKDRNKKYRQLNPEKNIERQRRWLKANPDKGKEYARKRRELNPDSCREAQRKYRENNRALVLVRYRDYASKIRKQNPEKAKKYREENPEKVRELCRKWRDRKKKSDPIYVIITGFRTRLSTIVKGKSSRIKELIGCSSPDLRKHLERQFKRGMTWENYGSHWHVDHIIPVAAFDHSDEKQVDQCWHWTNLQPMEAKENRQKSAKITEPQMSLLLCAH